MGFSIIPSDHYIKPGRITAADINRAFDDINNRLGGSNYVLPLLVADTNIIYLSRISEWGPDDVEVHVRDVTPYSTDPATRTGTLKILPSIPTGSCVKDTSTWEITIEGTTIGSGTFDGATHEFSGIALYGKTITVHFHFDFDDSVGFLDVRERVLFNFQLAVEALTDATDKPWSYYTIVGRAEPLPSFASSYPHVLVRFDSRVVETDATGTAMVTGTVYFSWGSDTTGTHWEIYKVIDGAETLISSGTDAISEKDFSFNVTLTDEREKEVILKVILGNSTFPNVTFTDKCWVITDISNALPLIEQIPSCVVMPPLWESFYTVGSSTYVYTFYLTTSATHWVGVDDDKRALKLDIENDNYEIKKTDGTWGTIADAVEKVIAIAHTRNASGGESIYVYDPYTLDSYIYAGDGTIPSGETLLYVDFLVMLSKQYDYSYIKSPGGTYTYNDSPIEFLYTIAEHDTGFTVVGSRSHTTHVHYYPILSSCIAFFDPTNISMESGGGVSTLRAIILNAPLQEADLIKYGFISSSASPTSKIEYQYVISCLEAPAGMTVEIYDDSDSDWHPITSSSYTIDIGELDGVPAYYSFPVRVVGTTTANILFNVELVAKYHDASGTVSTVLIERRHIALATFLSGGAAAYATSLSLPRTNFMVFVGGYGMGIPTISKPDVSDIYLDSSTHLYYLGLIAREPLKIAYGDTIEDIIGGESRLGGVTLEDISASMLGYRLDMDILLPAGVLKSEIYVAYDPSSKHIIISSEFTGGCIPIGVLIIERYAETLYPSLKFIPYVHTYVYEATRGLEVGRFGLVDKVGVDSPVIIATTHFENADDLTNLLALMNIGDSCLLIGENYASSDSLRFPYVMGVRKLAEDKVKLTMLTDVGMATVLMESASKYVYPVLDVFRIYYLDASGSLHTVPPPMGAVYTGSAITDTLVPLADLGDDRKILENIGEKVVIIVEPYIYVDKTLLPDPNINIMKMEVVCSGSYSMGSGILVRHFIRLVDEHGIHHIMSIPVKIMLFGSMYNALGGWGTSGGSGGPFTPIS